jgi:hypothetical protein
LFWRALRFESRAILTRFGAALWERRERDENRLAGVNRIRRDIRASSLDTSEIPRVERES